VVEKVRQELAGKDLREEEAREFIKGRIEFVESICKVAAGDNPPGKGIMMGGDRTDPPPAELSEQERAVKAQVSMLTSL